MLMLSTMIFGTLFRMFTVVLVFHSCVTKAIDITFNVTGTAQLGKNNIGFSCFVNPSVQVDQLYYIKLSRLLNNEWKSILLLTPDGLVWHDASFEERILTNTSQTETGILWLKIPVEKVLLNDSGTFQCFASWLTVGTGTLTSVDIKTIDIVENSSVPPVIITDPPTNPSFESSTLPTTVGLTGPPSYKTPSTTIELTDPVHKAPFSGSNATKSQGSKAFRWITLPMIESLAMLIIVLF